MARVFNFSAGPATLPEPVLRQARDDMLEYRDSGMSVMEMSHRSSAFEDIIQRAEASLRRLLAIPDDYATLFLQGGAWTQFAMVPLNLMTQRRKADYVNTGSWSKKAIAEAGRYGEARVVASSEDARFNYIPELPAELFDPDADYVHITSNNTIYGTAFSDLPDTGRIPLAVDMSSEFLSRPVDVRRCGLIYAGAQKNAGPAGVTVVILRQDLAGSALPFTPTMLDYATHIKARSLFNTPPSYAIYIAGLVFEWLESQGGLTAMAQRNQAKAAMLYQYLDHSRLFRAAVQPPHRSAMNVPFVTGKPDIDAAFIDAAETAGLRNLKGHRSVGGMRASLYNAMPVEGVAKLVQFMSDFEKRHA